MNRIKMEIITTRVKPLNRWDKDSIRPGPVGSVGDVNLQVKLKHSAPDLPQRYDKTFSGKNEVWSGSNISDGQWTGFTSGGRGAITVSRPMQNRAGFKTPVGWMIENILPVDRTRMAKMVPLGQYSWESDKARIYKAKTTGEQFLPLPMGYTKAELPRGSHFPRIVASSIGEGVALPAAEVKITDSEFGENGSIEVEDPSNRVGIPEIGYECRPEDLNPLFVWAPPTNDPRRKLSPPDDYPWRKVVDGKVVAEYPDVGPNEEVGTKGDWWGWKIVKWVHFNPCAKKDRPTSEPYEGGKRPRYQPPTRQPKPGDNRKIPIGATPPPAKRIKV
jgi:hypothetical protein